MTNPKTRLSKISHIGETLLTSELENGLKMYLDWGLLVVRRFLIDRRCRKQLLEPFSQNSY